MTSSSTNVTVAIAKQIGVGIIIGDLDAGTIIA